MDRVTELAISLKNGPTHLQELLRLTVKIRSTARLRYHRDGSDEEDIGVVWERALSFDARKGFPFSTWLFEWYRSHGTEEARRREARARWRDSITYEATSSAYFVDPEWLMIRAEELNRSSRTVAELLDQQDEASRFLVRRVVVDRDMSICEAAESLGLPVADAAERLRVALGTMARRLVA